jgi:hypothetical protein
MSRTKSVVIELANDGKDHLTLDMSDVKFMKVTDEKRLVIHFRDESKLWFVCVNKTEALRVYDELINRPDHIVEPSKEALQAFHKDFNDKWDKIHKKLVDKLNMKNKKEVSDKNVKEFIESWWGVWELEKYLPYAAQEELVLWVDRNYIKRGRDEDS